MKVVKRVCGYCALFFIGMCMLYCMDICSDDCEDGGGHPIVTVTMHWTDGSTTDYTNIRSIRQMYLDGGLFGTSNRAELCIATNAFKNICEYAFETGTFRRYTKIRTGTWHCTACYRH